MIMLVKINPTVRTTATAVCNIGEEGRAGRGFYNKKVWKQHYGELEVCP